MGCGRDAHKRIDGAYSRLNRLTIGIRLKALAQEASIALIDLVEPRNGRGSVGEGFRRDALWGQDAQCRVHVLNTISGRARIGADDSDFSKHKTDGSHDRDRLVDRLILNPQ